MKKSGGLKRRLAVGAAGIAAATVGMLPTAASAAPILDVTYDASGTAYIASTDSTIDLGPSTLRTQLDYATGDFSGSMPLPGTTTKFEVAGFIPVKADVAFVEAAPVTGTLSAGEVNSRVDGVASYHIRLSNIKIVGFPTITGSHCRTIDPVTIPISSPPEGGFDIFVGGTVHGEFSIGNFQNCGLNTWLINLLIPGSGNEVEIDITNARLS